MSARLPRKFRFAVSEQFRLPRFLLPKSFEFLSLFSPSFFVEICLILSLKLRLFACAYLSSCEAAYETARLYLYV